MSETTVETRVVGAGDDAITYDVRGDLADATPDRPTLMLIASPMEASAFGALAARFADRPVVTYDPRGAGRNPTGTSEVTPEQHADDLHRVITEVGGPVDLFASSGGAINALALAAAHPEDVRRLVAHEPPTAVWLSDRDTAIAVCADFRTTYEESGEGPAMAKFIAAVTHDGEYPADYLDRPAPDPADFGLTTEDDGRRTHPLFRNTPSGNVYAPDVEALVALGDRLVVAVGRASGETMAARCGRSVAGAVGRPVTGFAGDHAPFFGGWTGETPHLDAFAADLRAVLD